MWFSFAEVLKDVDGYRCGGAWVGCLVSGGHALHVLVHRSSPRVVHRVNLG